MPLLLWASHSRVHRGLDHRVCLCLCLCFCFSCVRADLPARTAAVPFLGSFLTAIERSKVCVWVCAHVCVCVCVCCPSLTHHTHTRFTFTPANKCSCLTLLNRRVASRRRVPTTTSKQRSCVRRPHARACVSLSMQRCAALPQFVHAMQG